MRSKEIKEISCGNSSNKFVEIVAIKLKKIITISYKNGGSKVKESGF